MPARAADLFHVRSLLVEDVLAYLDAVANKAAVLPAYYPPRLRAGDGYFDAIFQRVQVIEDRKAYESWLVLERERLRPAGLDVDERAYAPAKSRSELGEEEGEDKADRPAPPPPVAWDDAARQRFRRAVVLGDPGFGKTWLLRREARHLAMEQAAALRDRRIGLEDVVTPFHARLSDLNHLLADPPHTLADALVHHASQSVPRHRSAAFPAWLRGKLHSQACAVFLDALDEVPGGDRNKPHSRPWLRGKIEQFAAAHPELRLLLASRLADYTGSPIPAAAELELIALDSPQIEALATAWFGKESARSFLNQLRQSPQAAGLSRIPLLLTLLCAVYENRQQSFPSIRAELYECCVRGLVFEWREERTGEETDPVDYDYKRAHLVEAGHALHQQAREQFLRTEFLRACGFEFKRKDQKDEAKALADDLIQDGLLVRVTLADDPPLMFLHRTFQEYFAAQGLVIRLPDMTDETLCWDYLNLTHWTEPLVLAAQSLDNHEQAMRLVRLALQVDAMLGARLAGSVRAEWQEETVAKVRKIKGHDDYRFMLLGMTQSTAAATDFLRLINKGSLSDTEINALGKLGHAAATPNILAALARGLTDNRVRQSTAEAIGKLGAAVATPEFLEALGRGLTDPEWHVRQSTAEAVGKLGTAAATTEFLEALARGLAEPDKGVRYSMMEAVGGIGAAAATPEFLTDLLHGLTDPDKDVRSSMAEVIGKLGTAAATPEFLEALGRGLTDPDVEVRRSMAEAVGNLGAAAATPAFLAALARGLTDSNNDVRCSMARAVRALGSAAASPEILVALAKGMLDSNGNVLRNMIGEVCMFGNAAGAPKFMVRETDVTI